MRAQFGDGFRDFGWMRRPRNEVKYPAAPDVAIPEAELSDSIASARRMLDHAEKLLPNLGHFSG